MWGFFLLLFVLLFWGFFFVSKYMRSIILSSVPRNMSVFSYIYSYVNIFIDFTVETFQSSGEHYSPDYLMYKRKGSGLMTYRQWLSCHANLSYYRWDFKARRQIFMLDL